MSKFSRVRLLTIFAAPLLIAAVSLVGLVGALLGDGAWDVIGWIGLGIPVAVLVWARIRRPKVS